MTILAGFQTIVLGLLALGAFGISAWALIDALRRPKAAFTAAGKRTKTFWTVIVAVATAIAFASLPIYGNAGLPNFLVILSVVGAAVYLADVRPAVRQYSGRGRRDDRGNSGPYGPW